MNKSEVLAIIDRIKKNEFSPAMKSVTGSYLFDVEGVGAWRIEVDHGRIAVTDSAESGDCTIRTNAEDFVRIASGEQNLVTAFMQGRVGVEGDVSLAQKLHGIVRARSGRSS